MRESRRENLRRIAAFMAALSFVAVSNSGLMEAVAESGSTKTVKSVVVNNADEGTKVKANQDYEPIISKDVSETKAETTTATTTATTTTTTTTTTETTTTTTTTVVQIQITVPYNPINYDGLIEEYRKKIHDLGFQDEEGGQNLITSDNENNCWNTHYKYEGSEADAKKKLEGGFGIEKDNRYYNFKLNGNILECEKYYRINDKSNGKVTVKTDALVNGSYVNGNLKNIISPAEGYKFFGSVDREIDGKVEISDDIIKVNNTEVCKIEKIKFKVKFEFDSSNVAIEGISANEEKEFAYVDNNKIKIIAHNNITQLLINENRNINLTSQYGSDKNDHYYEVPILTLLNSSDSANAMGEETYNIRISSVENKTAHINFSDGTDDVMILGTENVGVDTDDNRRYRIAVPYFLTKGDEVYYLSGYSYIIDNCNYDNKRKATDGKHEIHVSDEGKITDYFKKLENDNPNSIEIKNDSYSMTPEKILKNSNGKLYWNDIYSMRVHVEESDRTELYYTKIEESEAEEDAELWEKKFRSAFFTTLIGKDAVKRNDNTAGMKKPASGSKIIFNFEDITTSEDADKGFTEDKKFIFVDSNGKMYTYDGKETETVDTGKVDANGDPIEKDVIRNRFTLALPDDCEYLKLIAVLDSNNEAVSFGEPIYIYYDSEKPKVEIDKDDNDALGKWQKESVSFKFTVSDYKIIEESDKDKLTTEQKESYDKINENQKLDSVKSIKIGDCIFIKPTGGWKNCSLSESYTFEENEEKYTQYTVYLTSETDDNGEIVFTAKVVYDSKCFDGFSRNDLKVTATDNSGNTSVEDGVNIKLDKNLPVMREIEIDNLIATSNANQKALTAGKDLVVNIVADDRGIGRGDYSGIESVLYEFPVKSDSEKPNANGAEYRHEFKFDKNEGESSVLRITLKDKAGNESVYYYSAASDDGWTKYKTEATTIIIDTTSPEKPVIEDVEGVEGKNGHKWIGKYTDLHFSVTDSGTNQSELKKLVFTFNDVKDLEFDLSKKFTEEELSIADINEALSNPKTAYIRFAADSTDVHKYIPYLCIKSGTEVYSKEICDTPIALYGDGKLSAGVYAVDYAGNKGDSSFKDLYLDLDTPEVGDIFENAEENGILMTKFGSFANRTLGIKIKTDDENKGPSSGFAKAILEFAGEKYETSNPQDFHDGYVWFIIPKEINDNDVISGEISLTVTDKVGHASEEKILVSSENKEKVVFDRKKPVISEPVIKGENKYIAENNKDVWYSSDVTVEYTVSDTDSGLNKVKFSGDNGASSDERNQYPGETEITESDNFILSTVKDGKTEFNIEVYDNAENGNSDNVVVFKDDTAPVVTGFEFRDNNSSGITDKWQDRFGHFFEDGRDVYVSVYDANASSGIEAVYLTLYNPDGTTFDEKVEKPQLSPDGNYVVKFWIPEGFKGDIKAKAVDNVKNESEEKNPEGCAAENGERHKATSSVKISMPETDKHDIDNLPLYKDNVTAKIEITDTFSGIKRIEWLTSDFEDWKTVEVNGNGDLQNETENWSVDQKERNIATSISREITVSKDSNGNSIRIKVTDNSGNTTEEEVNFSIDKQVPVISVSGITPSQDKVYYNGNKTANVVISERNFDSPDVNGSADGEYEEDRNSVRGTDSFRHTKTYSFDKDGEYTLEIEDTDLAGNTSEKYSSGKFVIDKTPPVLDVKFVKKGGDKVDPSKVSYIDDFVTAEISVNETNFDSKLIKINVNGKDYVPSSWGGSGSNHTAVVPVDVFGKDGEYKISVTGADLAGNPVNSYSGSFTVDTTKPVINVTGFSSANKGVVAPEIVIEDVNLESEEIKLTRNGKSCALTYDSATDTYKFDVTGEGDFVTGRWSESEGRKSFKFDNFPDDECFDGSYEITVTTIDMAANKETCKESFSVNRHGSVFYVEDMENIGGKHLREYPEIVITERNVDKHKEGSDVVVIIDKGSSTVELKANQYSMTDAKKLEDNSGYEYVYTIYANNFEQDLDYRISIQTVDMADNKNVSSGRGADLEFSIDTHTPEFKCDDLADRAEFRESSKEFRLNVNEKIKRICVKTNTGEILLDLSDEAGIEENSFLFEIPASNSVRSVNVEIEDMAGNISKQEFSNVLITENVFLFLFHKTWVKVTGILALLGAGGLTAFLIERKKRKKLLGK